MTTDRRQFSRVSFLSVAMLALPDGHHEVEIVDLSLKGALVRPKAPLYVTVGTNAVLSLALDKAGTVIRMGVTIVHHRGDTYGVYCHDIDLDSITHLRRVVELNLGDERELEREFGALGQG